MKKLILCLLTLLCMLVFAGCAGKTTSSAATSQSTTTSATTSEQDLPDITIDDDESSVPAETTAATTTSATTTEATTTEATTTTASESTTAPEESEPTDDETYEYYDLDPDGVYTSKWDVADYIYLYGCLPKNFITKKEAQELGWEGGSLEPYAPGMCIGGSRFGNYEGLLPEKDGRYYTECDIDTLGASKRGAKRIVFSNDGLIYYTEDHYESFELLYGEEDYE